MGRLWACTHFNSESRHAASSLKSSLKRAPVVHGSRVQVYFGPSGSSNLAGPHPQSASIVVDLSHALPSLCGLTRGGTLGPTQAANCVLT